MYDILTDLLRAQFVHINAMFERKKRGAFLDYFEKGQYPPSRLLLHAKDNGMY